MFSHLTAALACFCVLCLSSENVVAEEDDLTSAVRIRLNEVLSSATRKPPFFAAYKISMPPAPNAIGRECTLRVAVDSDGTFFSEEVSPNWKSLLLITPERVRWEYADESIGSRRWEGPLQSPTDPSEWLTMHDYPCNDLHQLDVQTITWINEWLRSSKVEPNSDASLTLVRSDLDRFSLASCLTLHVTNTMISVRTADPNSRHLLEYSTDATLPGWFHREVAEMYERFRSDAAVIRCNDAADMSFNRLMAQLQEQVATRTLPTIKVPQIAKRLGYYLPSVGTIISANGVTANTKHKELFMQISLVGGRYEVTQFLPPIPQHAIPDGFALHKRRMADCVAIDVHDPGSGTKYVYYFRDDVTFVCPTDLDGFGSVETLDALIAGFRKAQPKSDSREVP